MTDYFYEIYERLIFSNFWTNSRAISVTFGIAAILLVKAQIHRLHFRNGNREKINIRHFIHKSKNIYHVFNPKLWPLNETGKSSENLGVRSVMVPSFFPSIISIYNDHMLMTFDVGNKWKPASSSI